MATSHMKRSGFTLVELIVVMLIVGILAVAAIPRFFDRQVFESRGFKDEVLAILRYAQKTAIAQRRNVCATFTASTVILTIAPTAGSAVACAPSPPALPVTGPTGTSPYQVTARTGVAFAAIPANFSFNALGQASAGQTIQVSGASGSITVEAETGYVH